MGKYDAFKSKLPKFQQEPSFQEAVEAVKLQYQALSAAELAKTFSLERRRKKDFEEQLTDLNVGLEALSQLLVENFEAQGLAKLQLASGETAYQQSEPYSSIIDQSALMKWVRKEKLQALLTLQWQTINALNKERLVAGKPPLPGTQVFLKTSVRLRNGTASHEE